VTGILERRRYARDRIGGVSHFLGDQHGERDPLQGLSATLRQRLPPHAAKIEAHGYKKKRKKKAVDAPVELTASQTEAQLMENVIGWFEEAALPAAVNARVIAYLASRFAQGVVEYQQLAS
jgi:hypothetical protein